MAKEFFYQVMGEVFGPISGRELREKAVSGDITTETLVRIGGEGDWVHARRLSNLFDEHGRGIPHQEFMQSLVLSSAMAFREVPQAAPAEPLLNAISYAARLHQGQLRKDNRTPYSAHPMRVLAILMLGFGVDDADALTAAVLHDVIEDTPADFDDIEQLFGRKVAEYVAALTKDMRLPEAEREGAYLTQLLHAPIEVKLCKLADAYDNLLDAPRLSKKQQMRTVRKTNMLVTKFAADWPDEWKHAIDLVQNQIEKASGGLIHHE